MRLERHAFEWVCAAAAVAVAIHLGHLPVWLVVGLIVLVPMRLLQRRHDGRSIPAWLRMPLLAGLVAAVVVRYGNIFGRDAGSTLACGLLLLKLLETERIRDARAALGFAAFVLMSGLLFGQSLGFTAVVCLGLIPILAGMNALQPAPLNPLRRVRGELLAGARLLGLGLPLALAAFLFLPRLSAPLWGSPGAFQSQRTGLSDEMSPGGFGELLLDDTPALRVGFDGRVPPSRQRYFRALVLWDFDGRTWTNAEPPTRDAIETVASRSPPLTYEITLEPNFGPWLVGLDVPLRASEPVRMRADRTLRRERRQSDLRQYRVESALDYVLGESLAAHDRARALRLPEGFNPRARELADEWRAQARDDAAIVAAAIERFGTDYTYTLAPPLLGRHSVDEFLFDTHAGYCEHFSSAFVFLMRAAGVPARVVTGYQGGWWNEVGDYLLVRQSDAHAWAEVWLQGRGWVRVDPTAAVDPARIVRSSSRTSSGAPSAVADWLLGLRNQLDIVNRLWTQSVVQFNALRQQSLLQPFGIERAQQRDLLLGLAVFIALVLLLATAWAMRGQRAQPVDRLDAAWNSLCAYLRKRGADIPPQLGPFDLLARVESGMGDRTVAANLSALVHGYVQLRYACMEADATAVNDLARRIRRWRLPAGVRFGA